MYTISDCERLLGGRMPGIQGARGHFAVLAALVDWEGEAHLLFEVRSDTIDRQPGEISFPGGEMEPGETPEACALRETWEELSIPARAIHPIAPLDVLHTGDIALYPILARVDADAVRRMRPSEIEVKDTFLAPLSFFDGTPYVYPYDMTPPVGADFPYGRIGFPDGYPWRRIHGEVVLYEYGVRPVWGLTASIIRHLLRTLHEAEQA